MVVPPFIFYAPGGSWWCDCVWRGGCGPWRVDAACTVEWNGVVLFCRGEGAVLSLILRSPVRTAARTNSKNISVTPTHVLFWHQHHCPAAGSSNPAANKRDKGAARCGQGGPRTMRPCHYLCFATKLSNGKWV